MGGMHEVREGRAILVEAQMARLDSVMDSDYDPIRHMTRLAAQVPL